MPSHASFLVRRMLPLLLTLCAVAAIVLSCADHSDCGLLDCSNISSSSSGGDVESLEEEWAEFDRIEHTLTDDFEAAVSAETGGILPVLGCTLTIPAGALEEDTTIGVSVYEAAVAGERSTMYRFTPSGLEFLSEVSVAIEYDSEGLNVPAFYWTLADDLNGFEAIEAEFNDGKAVAKVNHFSIGYVGLQTSADGDLDGEADTETNETAEMESDLDEETETEELTEIIEETEEELSEEETEASETVELVDDDITENVELVDEEVIETEADAEETEPEQD